MTLSAKPNYAILKSFFIFMSKRQRSYKMISKKSIFMLICTLGALWAGGDYNCQFDNGRNAYVCVAETGTGV